MRGYSEISCLILLMIFSFLFSYSQEQQYKFEHFTAKDGLSHNSTNCIIQDSKGFIWIGTNMGLNRYDGYNFKNYMWNSIDSSALSGDVVKQIYEDSKGNLWIGTAGRGLNRYNRFLDNFTSFEYDKDDTTSLSHNHIKSIYEDKQGTIWIGTYGGGLNKLDNTTESFSVYKQFPDHPEHDADKIYAILEDYNSTLWIGTELSAFIFDRKEEIFHPFDFNLTILPLFKRVQTIHCDINNNLWFGTLNGIIKYDRSNKKTIHLLSEDLDNLNSIRYSVIQAIVESSIHNTSTLWCASRHGLIEYSVSENQYNRLIADPKLPTTISENFLNDVFIDNSDNLWIATRNNGLNKLNIHENLFQHYFIEGDNGMQYSAGCFYVDREEYLWVGAWDGGLFKFDKDLKQIDQYKPSFYVPFRSDSMATNTVTCIYEDSDNNFWVGFEGLGLTIFNRIDESFFPVTSVSERNDSTPVYILNVLEDSKGRFWVGDAGKGLFYKNKKDKKLDPLRKVDNPSLTNAIVRDLIEDSKGNIWVATLRNGLFCLKPENRSTLSFTNYQGKDSDSNGYHGSIINSVCEDAYGKIWITTFKGLNFLDQDSNKFEIFEQHDELFGDQIIKIFPDKKGNLWFNNYMYGLIRFNTIPGVNNPVKRFTIDDGLPYDEFSYLGLYQSLDGRIFIGSTVGANNGFFCFHPDSIHDNTQIPEIAITNFKVKNENFFLDSNITQTKHINLKHNQNFFSFEFAALDFTNSAKIQYAYYLDGLEDEWVYLNNSNSVNYTGVPHGKYTFHIKGSNNDGYWNETGKSISISILPPLWKTWWAYILYGLFIAIIFYIILRYYSKRQQLLHKMALEQVQYEKLEELDKMKSRFFANISHEFRTPLTLILGPLQNLKTQATSEKSIQDLSIMQRNAFRLKNLIDQLLNLSKLESGKMKLRAYEENIVALVNGYVQSFESLAKQKKIDLIFSSVEENIHLFVDKDKIEKILYNLLSNAFKFTGEEGKIEVFINLLNEGKEVNISVSDTGSGIHTDKLEHIFDRFYQADDSYTKDQEGTGIGLAFTKELVKIHHGKIIVDSQVGKGTTFNVILPAGCEHLKPYEIVDSAYTSEKKEDLLITITDLEYTNSKLKQPDHKDQNVVEEKEDKPHLLIVDDNNDLRTYMKGYLDPYYYISEAKDGEEGFNLATKKIPDLIISDVMMPKMDGYGFCRKLKTDEMTSHIPVILLTAKATMEDKLEGLELGADDFIYKPFNGEELHIRVKNLISLRKKLKDRYRKEYNILNKVPEEKIPLMDRQFLDKANEVVNRHLSDSDFSVETFANELGLSRVQLHRKLRGLLDQSSGDFIRVIRLNKSIELLKEKSGNISEIAYDVGFSSPSYFSECFRQQFGQSPSEFQLHNK